MVLLWWCFSGGVVSSTVEWCFSGGVVVWWCGGVFVVMFL